MNPYRLNDIAAQLHKLRFVPTDVLAGIVRSQDGCLWSATEGEPPEPTGDDPDRELAAELCSGCPVKYACLELELRLHGPETTGVWGGLSEQDRRAVYLLWLEHRVIDPEEGGDEA